MPVKTGTISVRLPLELIKHFDNLCKAEGIAKNKAFKNLLQEKGIAKKEFGTGGLLIPNYKIPPLLENTLIGIGGGAVGFAVYHLIKHHLPNSYIEDKDDREALAVGLGITAGLGMAYGLYRAIKK